MAAMKMMMAVAGTVLNVIRSQLERKRVEIGIVNVNRAKENFRPTQDSKAVKQRQFRKLSSNHHQKRVRKVGNVFLVLIQR